MTIVRDLWLARDEIARQIDLAPGRVLGDLAIIELATLRPDNLEAVAKVISWRTKLESPPFHTWLKVLNNALKTPLDQQPEFRVASENLPPMKIWKEKNPLGYARLTHARAALIELSKQIQILTTELSFVEKGSAQWDLLTTKLNSVVLPCLLEPHSMPNPFTSS
jgi:ribonuclease D